MEVTGAAELSSRVPITEQVSCHHVMVSVLRLDWVQPAGALAILPVLLTRHPCANLFVLAFPFCPACLGYSESCLSCPNLTAGHFSKSLVPVIEHRVPNGHLDLNVLVTIQGCHWPSQPTEREHVCLLTVYTHTCPQSCLHIYM